MIFMEPYFINKLHSVSRVKSVWTGSDVTNQTPHSFPVMSLMKHVNQIHLKFSLISDFTTTTARKHLVSKMTQHPIPKKPWVFPDTFCLYSHFITHKHMQVL